MPAQTLDTGDAAELAEMLQFLSDWLAADPARLGASLAGFTASSAYTSQHLRDDLDRFTFLLGSCPVCATPFTPARRQRYCTPACRQTAFRRRQPAPLPQPPPPGPARRQASIYQCGECDQRYQTSQWCHDCNRPCRLLGYGGPCPCCDEAVAVSELLSQ